MLSPTKLRQKHSGTGPYLVDAKLVGVQQCSIRSMNFGQHWRSENTVPVTYSVTLPSTLFAELVDKGLPELIDDMKKFPESRDEYEQLLRAHNWPETTEKIMLDNTLAIKTLAWFGHEMMLRWFGDGEPSETPGFVFNTIESTTFNGHNPVIVGLGRIAGQAVKFQDI